MKLLKIVPSNVKHKKYDAYFLYDDGKEKKISFGAKGYSDYTLNKDPKRKENYLARHGATEGVLWRSPDNPASLARWILWEEKSFQEAVQKFRTRFRV